MSFRLFREERYTLPLSILVFTYVPIFYVGILFPLSSLLFFPIPNEDIFQS